ncbi:MAG: pyridoxine/pyridoxamine 5'-phosphate oxidase, partial [Vulcanimicrobiaceae bacterium]
MTLESNRHSYEREALDESTLATEPILQLRRWLDDAYAVSGLTEPNAMCVATVAADGHPSNRVVLLRGLDDRGLTFYTSYFSRKSREIDGNPNVAATFFWPQLERQVRVEGVVTQLPEDESDAYFATRPRGHRLSAWASEQSE